MKFYKKIPTKLSSVHIVVSDKGLESLGFEKIAGNYSNTPTQFQEKLTLDIEKQIHEYIQGKRTKFEIPLDLQGSDFQKRVWRELLKIPYGKTISYKMLATQIGDANASRAVGGANGKNPICIVIPCHRVINASGSLGGYSGGLDKKISLLKVEKIIIK